MKSLFNENDNQEIIKRVDNLTPGKNPEWGKMKVAQMLHHCSLTLESCFGEIKPKRVLIGILFGNMIKKKIMKEGPFSKNSPTSKEFLVKDDKNFEEEKSKLISYIKKFIESGKAGVTKDTHPFFGYMTVDEWDILIWKHLDHHLRQFGV